MTRLPEDRTARYWTPDPSCACRCSCCCLHRRRVLSRSQVKSEYFPLPMDGPSKTLTVVIPAHNEEERLPGMLKSTLAYLQDRQHQDRYGLAFAPTPVSLSLPLIASFPPSCLLHMRVVTAYMGDIISYFQTSFASHQRVYG